MSRVLKEIIAATGQERPSDPSFVLSNYIENPTDIRCSVALDDADEVLGFQSLIRAGPDNLYGTPEGWGIIGTHIRPGAHRLGLGRALFAVSLKAATEAGLQHIEASIAAENAGALRY